MPQRRRPSPGPRWHLDTATLCRPRASLVPAVSASLVSRASAALLLTHLQLHVHPPHAPALVGQGHLVQRLVGGHQRGARHRVANQGVWGRPMGQTSMSGNGKSKQIVLQSGWGVWAGGREPGRLRGGGWEPRQVWDAAAGTATCLPPAGATVCQADDARALRRSGCRARGDLVERQQLQAR